MMVRRFEKETTYYVREQIRLLYTVVWKKVASVRQLLIIVRKTAFGEREEMSTNVRKRRERRERL